MMKGIFKGLFLWAGIFLIVFAAFSAYHGAGQGEEQHEIAFSDFIHELDSGHISGVIIRGYKISGQMIDGKIFTTYAHPQYAGLINKIISTNAKLKSLPLDDGSWSILGILLSWAPMLFLIGIWIFSLRRMQGGGKAMGFGRSKARLSKDKGVVTFADVAGIDESKSELIEIVRFLKNPQEFTKLGAKIPKGVLLVGPPGTGKTLLAKAIAGESGVPFFSISGSDFVEMFVGVGASRVRDMFAEAKKHAPCIIFIDEIDAVGRNRGSGTGGGHDEREQTLNQLLVEMDGFEKNSGIVIIAATNRADVLDPALLRPGRFDRKVYVSLPDVTGRREILLVHMKSLKLSSDVDPMVIAKNTIGFSGADLANLTNEAAILAALREKDNIGMLEFDDAIDKIVMGKERKSMSVSVKEKKITAYHEGGHALVGFFADDSMRPYKATIVPRANGALGFVASLPSDEQFMISKAQLLARISVALAGRIAESMIFGEENITTGAQSDLRAANGIAREMVMRYGMSKLGMIYADTNHYGVSEMSDSQRKEVDNEIQRILGDCREMAQALLIKHLNKLHLIAKYLLEKETLTGEQIKRIFEIGNLNDPENNDDQIKENTDKFIESHSEKDIVLADNRSAQQIFKKHVVRHDKDNEVIKHAKNNAKNNIHPQKSNSSKPNIPNSVKKSNQISKNIDNAKRSPHNKKQNEDKKKNQI